MCAVSVCAVSVCAVSVCVCARPRVAVCIAVSHLDCNSVNHKLPIAFSHNTKQHNKATATGTATSMAAEATVPEASAVPAAVAVTMSRVCTTSHLIFNSS